MPAHTKKVAAAPRRKKVSAASADTEPLDVNESLAKQMHFYGPKIVKETEWAGRSKPPTEKSKVFTGWALGVSRYLGQPEGAPADEIRTRIIAGAGSNEVDLVNNDMFLDLNPNLADALARRGVDAEESDNIVSLWTIGLELGSALLANTPDMPPKYLGHLAIFAAAARAGLNGEELGELIDNLKEFDGSKEKHEADREKMLEKLRKEFGDDKDLLLQALSGEGRSAKSATKTTKGTKPAKGTKGKAAAKAKVEEESEEEEESEAESDDE